MAQVKIAFVSANQEKLPDPVVPLGILMVMSNLDSSHEVKLWDLCFEDDIYKYLASQLKVFQPDVVAVGIRNIQNNDYSDHRFNVKKYKQLFDWLRTNTNAKLIVGGSGFSVMPSDLMKVWRPDFGISGEAEVALRLLVESLAGGAEEFGSIPNLYHWRAHQLCENPPGSFLDMDSLKVANREFVDPRYLECGIQNVQIKRGCPLRCTYCSYPKIEGRIKRNRNPSLVVREMFEVLDTWPQTNHFFVVDSVFNHPRDHAKSFCRELIKNHWRIPWTCYVNPLSFDEELAELMAEAKCAGFEVGSDSGSDQVLGFLKKGFLTKDILRMKDISKKFGLKDCHTFILGTPGESHSHVDMSLKFIEELEPTAAVLMAWNDDHESLNELEPNPKVLKRQQFRREIIEKLKISKRPNWIIPPLSYNFDERLFRILRKRKSSGPLWQTLS